MACSVLERVSGLEPSSENCSKVIKACYSAQLLPFHFYLSVDDVGAVCHQFGLLGPNFDLISLKVLSRLSFRASTASILQLEHLCHWQTADW